MLVTRYIWRELGNVALATAVVLLLILVSIMLVRYLHIASGSLGIALKISALRLPYYLGMLIPVAFFFAIILAMGRLFTDNEMVVLFASGMSWWRLLKIVMPLAFALSILVALITVFVTPALERAQARIMQQYREQAASAILRPGLLRFSGGNAVVYVKAVAEGGRKIGEVQAIIRNSPDSQSIFVAPNGRQYYNRMGDRLVELSNGKRYDLKNGKLLHLTEFKHYAIRVQKQGIAGRSHDIDTLSMYRLLKNGSGEALSEFQWRLAVPLAALVLALLAVSLSYVPPRKGRYAGVFPAVLVFAVYFNLLAVVRNEIEAGTISMWFGLLAVPCAFSLIALLLIRYHNRGGRWR